VRQLADRDGLGNRDFAHQRLGGLGERGLVAAARAAVAAAAARMPAADAAAGVAWPNDNAPAPLFCALRTMTPAASTSATTPIA
jgi:hypothetical protein